MEFYLTDRFSMAYENLKDQVDTMARPRKYDAKLVSQKIMDAFWKDGFEATSISSLMTVTSMKKGSLYSAYGDKNGMFYLALLEYEKVAVNGTINTMDSLPGREALEALLTGPAVSVEANDRRGCLLCNSLAEYGKLDDSAQQLANACRSNLTSAIARALERFYGGGVQQTKAVELLALYFGLRVLARGGMAAAQIRAVGVAALESL